MIIGKQAVLFIGVFSSVCIDTGLCGRLRSRDGGDRVRRSSRGVREGRNTARVPGPEVPRDEPPPIALESQFSASVAESASFDSLSDLTVPSSTQGTETLAAQSDAGQGETPRSVSSPTAQPEISSTPSVTGSSSVLVDSPPVASLEVLTSLSAVGNKATVAPAAVTSSSEEEEYVYPGVFGAGGSLTTDSKAPTRSVAPSKSSVSAKPKPSAGPPPADRPTTRPQGIMNPPAAPPVIEEDIGWTFGAGQPADATTEPAQVAKTTRPRGPPTRPPAVPITEVVEETIDLGWGSTSSKPTTTPVSHPAGGWNSTWNFGPGPHNATWTGNQSSGDTPTTTINYCQASDATFTTLTTWSVVHTSTVTWFGDPKDYTQPFPPIVTPPVDPLPECVVPLAPPRLTLSVCSSTGTGTKYVTCTETTSDWNFGPVMGTHTMVPTATVTFLTTDKNPAVVFQSITTPDYGQTTGPRTKDHLPVTKDQTANNAPPPYRPPTGGTKGSQVGNNPPIRGPTPKPVTVIVRPSAVIINGNTIRDNPPVQTQVVVIDGQTFTIDPSQVVGGGATVTRPSTMGGIFVPTPTSTNLRGIPVVIDSSVAVIDGTSHTISPARTTATVRGGIPVVIGADGIVVGDETVAIPAAGRLPAATEVVVAGGELLTAIGRSVVVIFGTTITYGLATDSGGSSVETTHTVVGDDTITLGPSGIVVAPGTTLGGPRAKVGETQYAVVGGVTLTEIGESVVVIRQVTYTVGPGSPTVTTIVAGETVTIGPAGVTVGESMSFPYPFGPESTTTITPGGRPEAATVTPTGGEGAKASEDAGVRGLVPGLGLGGGGGGAASGMVSLLCIAIGVGIFGGL